MKRPLSAEFVQSVENNPAVLLDELKADGVSSLTAVFVVGRILRSGAPMAAERNQFFEGVWKQRLGRKLSKDYSADGKQSVIDAQLQHLHKIVATIQEDPDYSGVWGRIVDGRIFTAANKIGADIELYKDEADPADGFDEFDDDGEAGMDGNDRDRRGLGHLDHSGKF